MCYDNARLIPIYKSGGMSYFSLCWRIVAINKMVCSIVPAEEPPNTANFYPINDKDITVTVKDNLEISQGLCYRS